MHRLMSSYSIRSFRHFLAICKRSVGLRLLPRLFVLALLSTACDQIFPIVTQTPDQPALTQSSTVKTKTPVSSPVLPSITPKPVSVISIRAEELRGVMIRFWHPWSGTPGQVIDRLVEEFNLTNQWGILVTAVRFPGYDALEKNLESSFQTSYAPQATLGYLHQMIAWDKGQNLVDLTPYVADPQWGLSASDQADFYPQFWNQDVLDGRRLGLPAIRSAQLMLYNETWAKELGFEQPPADADQFLQQACTASRLTSAMQRGKMTAPAVGSSQPIILPCWAGSMHSAGTC